MARAAWSLLAVAVLMLGCERKDNAPAPTTASPLPVEQPASLAALNRGARLYAEHCAQCHGPEAQGHPDWENRDIVAAPPLNGTGNDWKRTRAQLVGVIKHGAKRRNAPVMPAWNGRLSDQEIEDIIAWFQASWPSEVYATWRKVNPGPTPRG